MPGWHARPPALYLLAPGLERAASGSVALCSVGPVGHVIDPSAQLYRLPTVLPQSCTPLSAAAAEPVRG